MKEKQVSFLKKQDKATEKQDCGDEKQPFKITPLYELLKDLSSQAVTDFNNVWLDKKNKIVKLK